jgi:hypothetical protein
VNPERAELVERDQRGIVVGDQHGLGDLKLQPPRVEPGFGQRGRDLERQRSRLELDRRDVDGDPHMRGPAGGLGAGGAQHPLADPVSSTA